MFRLRHTLFAALVINLIFVSSVLSQATSSSSRGGKATPTPANTPPPQCGPESTMCGTTPDGKAICCAGKSDCPPPDNLGAGCKTTRKRCGLGGKECGTTCCAATERCNNGVCSENCPAGQSECNVPGGCCPEGTRCHITTNPDGSADQYSCKEPTDESRCKPPQFPCTVPGGDPFALAPATVCCNPGASCGITPTLGATCCPPGYRPGSRPDGGEGCVADGPRCDVNGRERYCLPGQKCCGVIKGPGGIDTPYCAPAEGTCPQQCPRAGEDPSHSVVCADTSKGGVSWSCCKQGEDCQSGYCVPVKCPAGNSTCVRRDSRGNEIGYSCCSASQNCENGSCVSRCAAGTTYCPISGGGFDCCNPGEPCGIRGCGQPDNRPKSSSSSARPQRF